MLQISKWSIGLALWLAAGAQAGLVSIDITSGGSPVYSGSAASPGGLVPLTGQVGPWNELDLGDSLAAVTTTVSVTDALDGQGNPTTIDFLLNTNLAPALQAFSGNGDSDTLGSDMLFSTSNTVVGWRFEGLEAGETYRIRFFSQINGGNPHSFTTFTVTGSPDASASTSALQNYVDLVGTADELGVISGTFTRVEDAPPGANPTNATSLSAIQIQLIPEPGSAFGLGSACAMLLLRRKPRQSPALSLH